MFGSCEKEVNCVFQWCGKEEEDYVLGEGWKEIDNYCLSCEGENHDVVFGGRSKKLVLEWRWKQIVSVCLSGVEMRYKLCV